MKNIFKSLMLVAVAAMGFACQDKVEDFTPERANEVVMTITADVEETRTYIDEANKVVKWSAGDQLKVIENSAVYRTTNAATIDADGKAQFTVSFPANTSASEFTYNAVYPATAVVEDDAEKIDAAKVKVIVKEAQKPTATSFDPAADVLVAKQVVVDAQPTSLNMQFKRLVAMGKMSLTGLPVSSKISQVVFKAAASDKVAGRNYINTTSGEVVEYSYYGATNTLTLSYDAPISTRDVYFACNPFEMEAGEVFTVKVVCDDATYTREVEIPAGRSLVFAEADLNTFTVDMKDATKEANFVFAEGDYAVLAVSGGKYYALLCDANGSRLDSKDEYAYDGSGSITLTDETANMRWTVAKTENGYTFKGANDGYIAWYNNGNYAKTQAEPYYLDIVETNITGRYDVVSKADATRKLQRNSTVTNRYFAFYTSTQMGSLLLVPIAENTAPYFTIEQDVMEYTYDGDTIEFTVVAHNGFDAEVTATADVEWIEFDHDGYSICAYAEENDGAAREAVITFSAEGYKSVEVTVKQEAAPDAGDGTITVAEFLAAEEDETTMYTLKGTITAVANTTYGNFDLTDDTGTVYIYGLMSPDGATNKYWSTSKAKLGDDIVIKTIRTSFNNTPQGKDAWFVELVSPGTRAFYTVDPAAVDFASAGGEQDIEVSAYNTTAAVTATSDNDAFVVAVNGYVVTVTAAANELEEQVTGNISIKVGDLEATVVKATLAAKPASGVVEGGSDDFHTISTNTSYVSSKTTAGWEYKNCAILKGGSSNSSPAFIMIGDASNRALCMNGKTSNVGTITSPTLTTGCGTLKFNYGLPFSDTKIKFRVDIMQNGTVVKTFTVNPTSVTKLTKYSHEEVINVAGDFQIVFTNLSPSSSTSNKDRTAIWDVEWTGYKN